MPGKLMAPGLIATLCLGLGTGWGQITRVTADQAPPKPHAGHDYIKLMNETISPAVGAVDLKIGIDAPPGREIEIPFAIGYDSNSTRHSGFMDNASYLQQGGWRYIVPLLQYSFSVTPVFSERDGTIIAWCDTVDHHTFTDGEGTLHPLGLAQSPLSWANCIGQGNWESPKTQNTDGLVIGTTSLMSPAVGPNPQSPPVTVFDHDGTRYSFPNDFIGRTRGGGGSYY